MKYFIKLHFLLILIIIFIFIGGKKAEAAMQLWDLVRVPGYTNIYQYQPDGLHLTYDADDADYWDAVMDSHGWSEENVKSVTAQEWLSVEVKARIPIAPNTYLLQSDGGEDSYGGLGVYIVDSGNLIQEIDPSDYTSVEHPLLIVSEDMFASYVIMIHEPKPDLELIEIKYVDNNISVSYKNIGEEPINTNFSIKINNLKTNISTKNTVYTQYDALEPGEIGVTGFFVSPGEYEAIIDDENTIAEADEDNNAGEITILYDFSLINLIFSKTSFNIGENISFEYQVNNNSNSEQQASYEVNLYISNAFIGAINSKDAGQAELEGESKTYAGTINSQYVPGKGNYEIKLMIVVQGEDNNTGNNTLAKTISVNESSTETEETELTIFAANATPASTTNSVTIFWETNLPADTYVEYFKTGYPNEKQSNGLPADNYQTKHSVLLIGITPEVAYDYTVFSRTADGKSASKFAKFTLKTNQNVDNFQEIIVNPEEENNNSAGDKEQEERQSNQIAISNDSMHSRLKGKIILKVEQNGEAYYVHPVKGEMYYLGRPHDAFTIMREHGIGITNANLYKIPIGMTSAGEDSDGDGLSDYLENTLGLNPNKEDTDGDGYKDGDELSNGYSPWGAGKQNLDNSFTNMQKGKIFLQVENNGEAWYVNPADNKRYFLGRPTDAFNIMRYLGLGISNGDFDKL